MLFIYFNGASTSPFAVCSVSNKACEEEVVTPLLFLNFLMQDILEVAGNKFL